jgi:hypothetical protein
VSTPVVESEQMTLDADEQTSLTGEQTHTNIQATTQADTQPDTQSNTQPTHNPNANLPPVSAHIPTTCDTIITDADIHALIGDDTHTHIRTKYTRFKFLQSSPHARECPYEGCGHMQIGDPANPAIICGK